MTETFSRKHSKDQSRDTGMALVLALLVAYALTKQEPLVFGAIALHVANMIVPQVFWPVAMVWFGLSRLLGTIVSKILLFVVFLAVVTPLGLARRLLGRDSLQLRAFRASEASVMVQRNHTFSPSDIEKPY